MAQAHLLVIDDEPAVSVVLEHACQSWGHRMTVARSLASARAALQGETFDLAIIDVGLPDGDGLDFLAELRQESATATLPAIILTGAGADDVFDRAEKLGGNVVTKPFSPSKLGELVASLVSPDAG